MGLVKGIKYVVGDCSISTKKGIDPFLRIFQEKTFSDFMIIMKSKILEDLKKLDKNQLLQLRDDIDQLIKENNEEKPEKRKNQRVPLNIAATCEVEREKQFFELQHKIRILDLSSKGLRFKSDDLLLEDDLLSVFFRSPSNGIEKKIDCKVVRVTEVEEDGTKKYHMAAKAVSKEEVRRYKEWLSKRGK